MENKIIEKNLAQEQRSSNVCVCICVRVMESNMKRSKMNVNEAHTVAYDFE